jgi:hypothetical protein
MLLSRILQWWRLGASYIVHLGGAGVGRRPLATVAARNPWNHFVFFDFLGFYLEIQDSHFIPVCLLVSTCVAFLTEFLINEIDMLALKENMKLCRDKIQSPFPDQLTPIPNISR